MPSADYDRSVFVNCPLDEEYRYLFEAVVFAIQDCGYMTRCALEVADASEVRIDKITRIIADCRFGLHDISRTDSDSGTNLPRFNMPLELGLFLGAKRFGRGEQKSKTCLILDVERYRYQKFISDIAGQDIAAHNGDAGKAIGCVRDWLSNAMPKAIRIPGGKIMAERYAVFRKELPATCKRIHLSIDELTFNDYLSQIEEWLKGAPAPASG
jgi:hypothetical protein